MSYKLDGYDKKWSEWTTETKKEYTNLPEKEYVFRVKAKNVYNHQSIEATYAFSVLPPWYRTIWAFLLFGLLGLTLVYFIVITYTRYLRAVIREKTAEIREQKDEIEKQNEEITASIKYAERIQKAVVPSYERASELLPEHFVLWRPRDIVSGDFWWMTQKNGKVVIVAADCTGHGVPGAFVSMLGVSFLNEIVNKMEHIKANEILNQLRYHVKTTMKQTGKEGEAKDGMDLALVVLDLSNQKIQYAGAYNPLYLIRKGELIEFKADRNPIGIYIKELDSFTNHDIEVQKGDTLYIFSDGFVDQFGGEKGHKFKSKQFKELLLSIQKNPMLEQEMILDQTIDEWRGNFEQVDDIIIVGIRI
jgi:serine phosphatase RsbU (regulator of sigma subunit)